MIDFLSFHDIPQQESASIYFQRGPFFIIEWLLIYPPPSLTEEQSGKTEPQYPEGGHCQSVSCPRVVFNVHLVEAPFNVVSHPRDTVLLAFYPDRIAQILPFRLRVRQTVSEF
jgi:hypothetical protein